MAPDLLLVYEMLSQRLEIEKDKLMTCTKDEFGIVQGRALMLREIMGMLDRQIPVAKSE